MTLDVTDSRPGITRLRLDRPEVLNALDRSTVDALGDTLARLATDRGLRAVILTGRGRGFCSGLDLRATSGDAVDGRSSSGLLEAQRRFSRLTLALHELPVPVIAAVNGPAAGGGFALAAAADLRIASTTARFLAANIRLGVSGGEMGLSWRLPRLIGESRAADLLLRGRAMEADEALASGFVSELVAPDDLDDAAEALAVEVAGHRPFALAMTKELLDLSAAGTSLRHALDREDLTQVACMQSGDVGRAVEAFRSRSG